MVHLQVLYRTRPEWGHHANAAQWPTGYEYGPPGAYDALSALGRVREFDCRMFAFYFLITESLATYLGYRITQHCLRGRGLHMLPTSLRIWIVFGYCALKIRVIDYAFHGSLYEIVTMITAFCFALCTLVAIVFHFGPMQFVFADFRRQRQHPHLTNHARFSLSRLFTELKYFIMKQHFHEYAMELSSKHHRVMGQVATTVPTAPSVVLVPWLIVGDVELHVKPWNDWIIRHIAKAAITAARKKKTSLVPFGGLDDAIEARFVVLMLSSGLIIDILLKPPTPSMMCRLHCDDVSPFELVVRLTVTSTSNDRLVYFCYAECLKLVGSLTLTQKAAAFAMLVQLNAMSGHHVDVPLRSLRCKDFISAGCAAQMPGSRSRSRGDKMSARFESAFG